MGRAEQSALNIWATGILGQWTIITIGLFVFLAILEIFVRSRVKQKSTGSSRMITNFALQILTVLFAFLIPLQLAAMALYAESEGIGLFNHINLPIFLVLIIALLSRSFVGYWLHRLYHTVPFLWRLHRIHHNDPEIDLSTGFRHHPLTSVLTLLAIGSLITLLGIPLWAYVLAELIMLLSQLWQHANIRMPQKWVRWLGLVLVIPENHLIHHSARESETNSNYGNLLIIWDRIFGTYTDPDTVDDIRLGLGDEDDAMAGNLWKQITLPFFRQPRTGSKTPV